MSTDPPFLKMFLCKSIMCHCVSSNTMAGNTGVYLFLELKPDCMASWRQQKQAVNTDIQSAVKLLWRASKHIQIWVNIFIRSLWSPDECCRTLNRAQCLFTATTRQRKRKKKNPVSRSSHTVSFCGAFFFSVGAVCLGWCESCQSNPGVDQTTRQGQKRSHQTFSVFVRNIQTNEPTTGCLMMNFEN